MLLGQGLHLIVPVHQRRKVDFRRTNVAAAKPGAGSNDSGSASCGRCDQIVRWLKPQEKPRWMTQQQYDALPQTIEVREIKREVRLPTGLSRRLRW